MFGVSGREACEKDGPLRFQPMAIEQQIYSGWMKPALRSGRGAGLTKVFRSINAELLFPLIQDLLNNAI